MANFGINGLLAQPEHKNPTVTLESLNKPLPIFYRAMGGEHALSLKPAQPFTHRGKRQFLQRISGTGKRISLAWQDSDALYLPEKISWFKDPELNKALYYWLAALLSHEQQLNVQPDKNDWFSKSQQLTKLTLHRFPGLKQRYQQLVEATLRLRPHVTGNQAAVAQEQAIVDALKNPDMPFEREINFNHPYPVILWLHPLPPSQEKQKRSTQVPVEQARKTATKPTTESKRRRKAERVENPEGKDGLTIFRYESIFSWSEYLKVDRTTDDNDDDSDTLKTADDMEVMSVSQDANATTASVRFDLDLPSAEIDDTELQNGMLLPEWHYKKQRYSPNHCEVQLFVSKHCAPIELPQYLVKSANKLKKEFSSLNARTQWSSQQTEGEELDLDAYLQFRSDLMSGGSVPEPRLFRQKQLDRKDLSCCLLADLSLSTDTYIDDDRRIIDVIKDSLLLFTETLQHSQDQFAIYGFSSKQRQHVRVHTIKQFDEKFTAQIRGRIAQIKPGFYTRMGAAIRYTSQQLQQQNTEQKLLLLITDGKPNDLDHYEGRYGIEDTRKAILEAKQMGLKPFCITIDQQANDYLPHLFGHHGFSVIHKPEQLPNQLTQLYAILTKPGA